MPISLQAALQEGFQVGGSTVESVNAAAVSTMSSDFGGTFMTSSSSKGANASNSFAGSSSRARYLGLSQREQRAWQASNGASGNLGGALSPHSKANCAPSVINWKLLARNNVLPGSSPVAWT
jgi:hypothetical protein